MKLIGTTKATIAKIRERGHWNSQNIKAVDPVTLGLCTQIELDFIVARAAHRKPRIARKPGETLKTVEDDSGTISRGGADRYITSAASTKPNTIVPKAMNSISSSRFSMKSRIGGP